MSQILFSCGGGNIALPEPTLVLVSRLDGGNLIVTPSREVWDRSELSATELTSWSFLVAATAKAMLDTLPQLKDGCINYWDAGNWALNEQAEPEGKRLVMFIDDCICTCSAEVQMPKTVHGNGERLPSFQILQTENPGRREMNSSPLRNARLSSKGQRFCC